MNVKLNEAIKGEIRFLLNAAMVRLNDDEPTGRGYVLPIKERGPANPVCLVEVRSVYGNTTIYPANAAAERFAAIAGKKTLSNTDLMNIQALGFVIEESKPNKLCA